MRGQHSAAIAFPWKPICGQKFRWHCGKRVSEWSGLSHPVSGCQQPRFAMLPAELGIKQDCLPGAGFRCEFVQKEGTYRLQVISRMVSPVRSLAGGQAALEFTGEAINRQWLQRLARYGGAMLPWLEAENCWKNYR